MIRYNAEGVAGLRDRRRPGRPRQLDDMQLAALARLVEAGPDIAVHKVVRWRCVDLQAEIKARFAVAVSERHVGRLLKQLKFTRLSVRPRHPQADEAAQQAFKKTLPIWSKPRCQPPRKASRSRSGSRTRPGSARRVR